jgi:hypothetical protein
MIRALLLLALLAAVCYLGEATIEYVTALEAAHQAAMEVTE